MFGRKGFAIVIPKSIKIVNAIRSRVTTDQSFFLALSDSGNTIGKKRVCILGKAGGLRIHGQTCGFLAIIVFFFLYWHNVTVSGELCHWR